MALNPKILAEIRLPDPSVDHLRTAASANGSSLSDRQYVANRANARLSTGPRSDIGRRIASRNSLKHGLTGAFQILPGEDAARYQAHCDRFQADWQPTDGRETELVQTLADTQWRLNRVPTLLSVIYAVGHAECADLYPEIVDATMRHLVIERHVYRENRRDITNIELQEQRLYRQYAKLEAELKALQAQRKEAEKNKRLAANLAAAAASATNSNQSDGFVFSNEAKTEANRRGERTDRAVTTPISKEG